NFTARVLPAIFGVILIGFAWPLSRWIGRRAAIVYALLVLLSPHLNYFSRFIREDLYSLVFTLATILAFRMFLETDKARWLTLSAVAFALAGVTKENAYMTGVLFVIFGIWLLAERILSRQPPTRAPSEVDGSVREWTLARWQPFVTAGIVFLVIWVTMYTAFFRYPEDCLSFQNFMAIRKAVQYWIGQHSIARIPGPWYYYFPQLTYYETAICLAALLILMRAEVRRDPFVRSVGVAMVALAIYAETQVLLSKSPTAALRLLPSLFLAVGLLRSLLLLRRPPPETRPEPFLRFLIFWALASLAIYGWAREKVPWLTVHPLLPITILAAIAFTDIWSRRPARNAQLAIATVLILLAINSYGMYLACFRYGAYDLEREPRHGEYLAYVQTTEDLVRAIGLASRERAK